MRELKFRAWDGENMHNDFVITDYKWCIEDKKIGCPLNAGLADFAKSENWILMQFTGLKDKNNKEIYEGDVVFCKTKGEFAYPHQGTVEYLGQGENYLCGYFALNCEEFGGIRYGEAQYTPFWENVDFEILGNIYENQQLLNK